MDCAEQAQQIIQQKTNKSQSTYFMLVLQSIGHSTPVVWFLLGKDSHESFNQPWIFESFNFQTYRSYSHRATVKPQSCLYEKMPV